MPRLIDVTPCVSTTAANGLSNQILTEVNNVVPGILIDFSDLNISIDSKQFPFLQRNAKEALRRAIQNRGITMAINSAYRTCAQQFLLRRWKDQGQPCVERAALPGRSNHESGLALDVSDFNGWKPFLVSQGWNWFGTGDKVHFDFPGTPIGSVGIKAFQNLWNRNFPNQGIGNDGVYGPETKEKLGISSSEGFDNESGRRILRVMSPLMQGGDIRRVQIKLGELSLLNVNEIDGIYGEQTEKSVKRFQENQGITSDGVVGTETYEKLGI